MKTTKHFISACLFLLFLLIAFGSMDDKKTLYHSEHLQNTPIQEAPVENAITDPKKLATIEKLKEKAKKDWPNDYSTQEFWINEQIEAYDYMETIEDNAIKKQAQKDWPLDFSTQKFWYEEQVEAKQRLE
ncbi:hypothetical protein [uncultured Chryseobacterium sp.]|uniref:hypothetical protein n=1 Tax=uncultured Chryseobacterium sp. TaxID=259322 RepID=UPI0025E50FF4|nr:hypothetical protein [uncultured Chryseobacterium sp.]